MKIRSGFVSNSSSSSFIIKAEGDFSTVKDVAKYIISECLKCWSGDSNFNTELSNLNKISNPDTPVFFNTGDETYIRKVDDKIVIATTQNIGFDEISKVSLKSKELSIDFYKKFDYVDDDGGLRKLRKVDDFDYYYNKFDDFLMLEYNVLGREVYVDDCQYCKERFSTGVLLKNGESVCGCQIKKLIRRDKLNKINENNYNK